MPTDSTVHCVADVHAVLGEGPVWVAARGGALLGRHQGPEDLPPGRATGELSEWPTPFRVGSLAPRAERRIHRRHRRGHRRHRPRQRPARNRSLNPEADLPGNRFNDGKVDRSRPLLGGDDGRFENGRRAGRSIASMPDLSWTRGRRGLPGHQRARRSAPPGELMYHNDSGAAGHLRLRPRRRRQGEQSPHLPPVRRGRRLSRRNDGRCRRLPVDRLLGRLVRPPLLARRASCCETIEMPVAQADQLRVRRAAISTGST